MQPAEPAAAPTAMHARAEKLAWIQALRGIAAAMVVLVHSRSMLPATPAGSAAARLMLPLGMGVDLFFILSGFLMVLTTRDFDGSRAYAWRFAARRIARIWPLFLAVSLLAIAVDHHGLRGLRDQAVLLPYLEGLAFVPHDPLASGIYFRMAVGVAWTLCFECYFYALFATCMLCGRRRYAVLAAWFALTLVLVPLLRAPWSLNVAAQPPVRWSRYANLAINPIVWDFIFGMLAAWLYASSFAIRRRSIAAGTLALLAVLFALWHRLGMQNFFGPHGWGAPLAILFGGMALLARTVPLAPPAWTVRLGDISYSLYLVHVYVFELVQRFAAGLPWHGDSMRMLLLIARPLAAVLCAWITYHCVEVPANTWIRKRLLSMHMPRPLPAAPLKAR